MIRRLLFFFFVFGFIIGAPIIVLYTAGYRYNFQSGTVIRTGVLSISTSPRNAQILLDEQNINRQTPAVIEQLMPGDYQITLAKDGYHPWHNTETIQSNITTHLPLITLWRSESPVTIWQRSTQNITANPNGETVAYFIEQGGWNELWLDNLTENSQKMIARIPSKVGEMTLDWSTQGGYLLVHDQNFVTVSVYDYSGNNVPIVTTLKKMSRVFWHPSADHALYIGDTSSLEQLDLQTSTSLIISTNGDSSIVLDANLISLTNTETQTELRQTLGEQTKVIALLPKSKYSILQQDGPYLILQNAQNELLIIDFNSNEPILFKQSVKFFDYLANSHLLLWSDGNEINIYNPINHQTEFITRQGSIITQLKFSPDGNNIFVASENKLLVIDHYKNGAERYTATLLETDQLQNFWLTVDGKTAYIDGTINDDVGLYLLLLR